MPRRLLTWFKKLGRPEKIFIVLLVIYVAMHWTGAGPGVWVLAQLFVYIFGAIVGVRLIRSWVRKGTWRLRNRLILSYLFIAVVPIALILILVVMAGYVLMGQMAVYVISSELDRRMAAVTDEPPVLTREFLSSLAPGLGDMFLFTPDG